MYDYKLIRSFRKTISVQVLSDGSLLVRAPYRCPLQLIEDFLQKKEKLLERYREQVLTMPPAPVISKKDLPRLKSEAEAKILPRVQEISDQTGLSYNFAKITSARHRFGSCSAKNNLCFSVFLTLAQDREIDYVILHELCHTVEHNHSARFYQLVAKHMPDWKTRENNLKKMIIPEIAE